MTDIIIHPLVERGVVKGSGVFAGGVLHCMCADHPVKVHVDGPLAHTRLCGCTRCWKPAGARFSLVAMAAADKVRAIENGDKLAVVDTNAAIERHACKACGVHLYGSAERRAHPFTGLSFIHPERFAGAGAPAPTFASFVSSIIESGAPPEQMDRVRERLRGLGLPPYDCFNPPIMDFIAAFTARAGGARVD
jgi:S-(hydroxymethyl)glutathione synthase